MTIGTYRAYKPKRHIHERTLSLGGRAWRRIRARQLNVEPLCRHCQEQGYVRIAVDVDHINGDPSDHRSENLQSLCKPCHTRKTNAERGAG